MNSREFNEFANQRGVSLTPSQKKLANHLLSFAQQSRENQELITSHARGKRLVVHLVQSYLRSS